jgi:hypothetical protein
VAFWAKRSPWLSERLRAPIEAALAEASGRPVSLGGVGGGLSGWIWLQDVGMGPAAGARAMDLSVTARAVGLQFGFWRLLQGRPELADLKALRIEGPRLFLLRGQALSPSAQALPAAGWREAMQGFPLPPVRLDLRDGEAFEHSLGGPVQRLARGLRIGMEPDPQGWRLRGQADLESGGRVGLWGRSKEDLSGAELKARVQGLQVAPWAGLIGLPARLSVAAGSLAGELDLSQAADLRWSLNGQGDLNGLGVLFQGRAALQDGQGRWNWDGRRLSLSRLSGRSAEGRLEGGLSFQGEQGFQGQVHLRHGDLSAMSALLGAPLALSLTGRAELSLSARPEQAGADAPNAWGLALRSTEARWDGQPLSSLELSGQAQGSSASARLDLAWEGGEGSLSLDLDAEGLREARIVATALPAGHLSSWVGLTLSGKAGLQGSYRRELGQSPWDFALRSPLMVIAGLRVHDVQMSGAGTAQEARLRMQAGLEAWKGLNASLEAVARGEAWELSRLRVFEGEQLRLHASGRLQGRDLDLALASASLPLQALRPWLPAALQGLSGSAQAQGALRWRSEGASGELRLQAPALSAKGHPLPLAGRLSFAPAGVSLSALDLRRGEIKGSAQAPRWQGPWSADLSLKGADLAPWLDLAGSAGALSGTSSGTLHLDAKGALRADLELDEPWPQALPDGALSFALQGSQGRWDLERLELRQGKGLLRAAGRVDLRGTQDWQGQARWQGLVLHGGAWDGEASLSPLAGNGTGRLQLGPWSVSRTALPAVDAALRAQGKRLSGIDAQVGHATRVQWQRQAEQWWARADLQGQDPAVLLGPWLGKADASGLALNGWAEASLPMHGGEGRWQLELSDAGAAQSRLAAEGALRAWSLGQANWSNWDLARSAQALKQMGLLALPVAAGRSEGSAWAQAGGISISAKAQGLRLAGAELGPAELDAWFGPRAWSLKGLRAGGNGPQLGLKDWHGQADGKAWHAQGAVSLEQWPLALLRLGGEGALSLSGSDGVLKAQSRWRRLDVGTRSYPDLALQADWVPGRLQVAEGSASPAFRAEMRFKDGGFELQDLQARAGKGRAWLKGGVKADQSLSFEGASQGLAVGELSGWLGWPQAWTGAAYGTLSLGGTVPAVRGAISVKIEDGSVAGLPFDLASGIVNLEPGWVQLSPLGPIRLSRRNGVALEVAGKVPLGEADGAPPGGLEVTADLKGGGLALLAGLPAVSAATGSLEMALRFSGRRDDPQVSGRLRVQDGSVTPAWLLPPLDGVELFAQIEEGQFVLHKAQAQVAGGGPLLKLEPAVAEQAAFRFVRWLPASLNLRLRSSRSGLPLRSTPALQFVDGQAHPDLVLGGAWDSPLLQGELRLEKGALDRAMVQWPPQFQRSPGKAAVEAPGFLRQLRYDLRLHARQDVMARTEAAQAFVDTGEAGLLLTGGGGDPKELEGRLRFTRGSLEYFLASFQLAPGKETYIDFRRGTPPYLDVWGQKRVRDVLLQGEALRRDVNVRLHAFGPLGGVQLRLESDDAGLTQHQLASLAGLGVDSSDPRSQGGFARLLGKVPAQLLGGWMRRSGVVDELGVRLPAVEAAISGPALTPGPGEGSGLAGALTGGSRTLLSVDAGKYLGESLFVGVTGQINERDATEQDRGGVDPSLGGKVEYQLKDNTRVSAQHSVDTAGQAEQRVMLERSASFENYNPRRRRWDQAPTPSPEAIRARQTPPQPRLSPTPTPRWP